VRDENPKEEIHTQIDGGHYQKSTRLADGWTYLPLVPHVAIRIGFNTSTMSHTVPPFSTVPSSIFPCTGTEAVVPTIFPGTPTEKPKSTTKERKNNNNCKVFIWIVREGVPAFVF
jgi:hypothetical protein